MRDPSSRKDINNSGDACRQQQRTQQQLGFKERQRQQLAIKRDASKTADIQATAAGTLATSGVLAKEETPPTAAIPGASWTSNSSKDASNIRGVSNGRDAINSRHTRSIRDKQHQEDYYSSFGFSIMGAELLNFKLR
jgi:hypothetical protein